jgi:hypothetical protein
MSGPGSAISREQVRAAAVVVGLLLLSLSAWFVLGLVTTDPQPRAPDVLGGPAPAEPPPRSGGESAAGGQSEDEADDPDQAPTDGADDATDDAEGPDEGGTEPVTIDFDGVCRVEVEPAEQTSDPRPWDFEACERAPISLQGAETRWIVVLDSLAGEDFTEAEALGRTRGDQRLLWSTHYPSLNPDLWVVVEGPYDDRPAAIEAAERLGGGAYPRELSDDEGDRYCVAADGCIGETRD